MKKCYKCGELKDESEFNKNSKRKDGFQTRCRICQKKHYKKEYESSKEKWLIRKNKRSKEIRNNIKKFLLDYLSSHPCVDCGESDPIVLEFDHVRGKKKKMLSQVTRLMWNLESIKEEISKCEVRCANCHRRKTAKDFGNYKLGG